MLFTNGTGTGKTFTGLGVIKRMAKRGKDNIIITVPNDNVMQAWIRSGKALNLDITALDSTRDNGQRGIVITTYANFGANDSLAKRQWDMIVNDESHYLSANADGDLTQSGSRVRGLALHPEWYYHTAAARNPDLLAKMHAMQQAEAARDKNAEASPALKQLFREWEKKQEDVKAELEAMNDVDRPRVLFLSATPFAYQKSIEYGQGFLWDWNEGADLSRQGAYNAPDPREQFFQRHFGYKMRYGRMEQPDAKVDSSLMEQQFNGWLKSEGVLSGRVLDVDADYSRTFALVEDAIGGKIDEGMEWIRKNIPPLAEFQKRFFDYHARMFLLESIKARAFVPMVKKQMALGRKVVVFHDFNKGGGFHPFHFPEDDRTITWQTYVNGQSEQHSAKLSSLVKEFKGKRPDLFDLDFSGLRSPIETFKAAFPDVLLINGLESKKDRRAAVEKFNDDASGPQVALVQSDAGKEGISLHDTTGKHQRALFNLGMPIKPTSAVQIEGRTYRVGQVTDSPFIYGNTGTNFERYTYAHKIAERASTAENLALGDLARRLRESFIEGFDAAEEYSPSKNEGTGGKANDKRMEPLSPFAKAKTFYYAQGKRTSRDKSREGKDYFATPEPLALKMVEWAQPRPGEKMLEPSAGHGAIARWFPENTDRTIVEPSSELASRAALAAPGAKVVDDTFENLHVGGNKFDTIVMNPPFGVGGKTAYEHLAKAFDHLRDRGRIVALVPDGPAANKRMEQWYYGDDAKGAHLVADIKLPTSTFERAGTQVATRILVIDRYFDTKDMPGAPQQQRDYSDSADINALFDSIEHSTVRDRPEPKVQSEHTTDSVAGGNTRPHGAGEVSALLPADAPRALGLLIDKMMPTAINQDFSNKIGAGKKWFWETPSAIRLPSKELADLRQWAEDNGRYLNGGAFSIKLRDNVEGERGSKIKLKFNSASVDATRWLYEYAEKRGPTALASELDKMGAAAGAAEAGTRPEAAAAPAGGGGNLVAAETVHGKTGKPVYVAKPVYRVSTEEYERQKAVAKEFGGYYSSFRGNGAIPGFQFSTASDRDQFLAALSPKFALADGEKYRAGVAVEQGLRAIDIQKAITPIIRGWKNAPKIRVTAAPFEGQPANSRGVWQGGMVHLFANNIKSVDQAVKTLMHEVLGHGGLNGVFGAQLDPLLTRIYSRNPEIKRLADLRQAAYAVHNVELTKAGAVEEVLADMAADKTIQQQPFWKSLVAAIRNALRSIGIDLEFTEDDVAALLGRARRYIERGDKAAAVPAAKNAMKFEISAPEPAPWVKKMPGDVQEFLRKAGVWEKPKSIKERYREWRKDLGTRMLQKSVDQFVPVLRRLGEQPYKLLRMASSYDGGVEAMLFNGHIRINTAGALDIAKGSKGLLEILKPLQGETDRFLAWIAANRAERLTAEQRENLFGEGDWQAGKRLNGQLHPDDNFPNGTSGKTRMLTYAKVLREFNAFSTSVLDVAENAGLIDGEKRALWEHSFYVPFYREAEDGTTGQPGNVSGVVNQYAFKKLTGGTDVLHDLLANTINNWSHLLQASLKNNAAAATLKQAEAQGIAHTVRDAEKKSVFVMEDGKRHYYVVDDDLVFDAVSALEAQPFRGPVMKALQAMKHALSFGVTISPSYRIRNVVRDQIQALAVNPTGYNLFDNMLKGFRYSSRNNPEYGSMLAGGGLFRMGTTYQEDRAAHTKSLLARGIDEATVLDTPGKVKTALEWAWDWWKETGNRAESLTRANLYKQTYQRMIDAGKSADEAHFEASYVARDSMDFGLHGTAPAIRMLTQVVPFMNARLQGLYKLKRGAEDDPKRFAKVLGGVTLATIALTLAYAGDADFDKREEWDRDNYWWFKIGDKAFRIPKPFEIGAIATILDRGLEALLNGFEKEDRARFVNSLWSNVSQQLNMNPVPQAVWPVLQLWANKDAFTGRAIETEHDRNLSVANRFGPRTSATAIALGQAGILSPAQIDFLVNSYFAWAGAHVLATADFALRPMMGLPERAEPKLDDYFFVGDFAKELPSNQSRFVERFYEHLKDSQQALGDLRNLQKTGQLEAAAKMQREAGIDLRMAHRYEQVARELGKINSRIRYTNMTNMDAEAKREELDRLTALRNRMTEAVERGRATVEAGS